MGSYLVLAVATIVALSAILFTLFSRSAADQIAASSRELLRRTAYASDVLAAQIQTIAGHLINDLDVVSYLYSEQSDKIVDYNAMRALDRIKSAYTFIRSIGLYNRSTGGYLNNVGMASRLPLPDEGTPAAAALAPDLIPRVIPVAASPDRSAHSVLTRMYYPYTAAGIAGDSAIEINIDERYLQSVVAGIAGTAEGAVTMVLDRAGTVLSHKDPAWFMRSLSREGYVARILAARDRSGSFIANVDGEVRLVSFVKSDASGWAFVMTRAYASLIGNIDRLRLITLIVAAALAVFGAIVSVLLTGVVYRPLRRIVERVGPENGRLVAHGRVDEYTLIAETLSHYHETASELARSQSQSTALAREAFLRDLLKGESSNGIIPEAARAGIRESLVGTRFIVVVSKLDGFTAWKRALTAGEQGAARLRAARLAAEEIGRFHPCDALVMGEDEIALLVRDCEDVDRLVLALAELHRECAARMKASFTFGVGDPAYSLPEIPRSYAAAVERCRYRLFFGPGRVIDGRAVRARLAALPRYPEKIESLILESLKHGDAEVIGEHVSAFMADVEGLSYYQVMNCTGRLLLAIFWRFGESTELLDENYKDYDRLLTDIECSETMDELGARVRDFCTRTSALISEGTSRLHAKHNERIVQDVKRTVSERFAEPGLSLDVVAELVNLSPGYLAKLFKLVAGQSFGDYLNSVRLEKARLLLASTNRSAQAIGESVGIYNAPYFSTLFKKAYGLSPSRYRNRAVAS
jgi:AraC-like DNA-binding protein